MLYVWDVSDSHSSIVTDWLRQKHVMSQLPEQLILLIGCILTACHVVIRFPFKSLHNRRWKLGKMSWKHQQDYTVGSVFRSLRVGCQSEVVVIESLFHTDPNKCHIVMIMIVCHILGHQSLLLWVQSNHIDTVHIFLDSVVRTLPDHLQINIHESTQKS